MAGSLLPLEMVWTHIPGRDKKVTQRFLAEDSEVLLELSNVAKDRDNGADVAEMTSRLPTKLKRQLVPSSNRWVVGGWVVQQKAQRTQSCPPLRPRSQSSPQTLGARVRHICNERETIGRRAAPILPGDGAVTLRVHSCRQQLSETALHRPHGSSLTRRYSFVLPLYIQDPLHCRKAPPRNREISRLNTLPCIVQSRSCATAKNGQWCRLWERGMWEMVGNWCKKCHLTQ